MTLKSSEIKNFLSWRTSTILVSFLVSSSSSHFHSSTFHQTNIENSQIRSEDNLFSLQNSIAPSSSRGGLPWRRRVLSRFDTGYKYSSCRWAGRSTSSWSCFSLWSARKSKYIRLNANSSNFISEVSCSLSSRCLLLKSVTNLFKPWEILTHEWELIVFVYRFNSNFHSIFTLQVAGFDL